MVDENGNKNNYVCVDRNEKFKVSCSKIDNFQRETYGAVLYLDGKRVQGMKTFDGISWFHGFKQGNGIYKEFKFGDLTPS